ARLLRARLGHRPAGHRSGDGARPPLGAAVVRQEHRSRQVPEPGRARRRRARAADEHARFQRALRVWPRGDHRRAARGAAPLARKAEPEEAEAEEAEVEEAEAASPSLTPLAVAELPTELLAVDAD